MFEVFTTRTVRSISERPVRGSRGSGTPRARRPSRCRARRSRRRPRCRPRRNLASDCSITVLPVPNPPGTATDPALGDREEEVEDALPGDERPVGRQPRGHRPGHAHRPALRQAERGAVRRAARRARRPRWSPGAISAIAPRRPRAASGSMDEAGAFAATTSEHVAADHGSPAATVGSKRPAARPGPGSARPCRPPMKSPSPLGERRQRPADAVEHRAQQAGAELRQRAARRCGSTGSPEREPGRVLEDLDGGRSPPTQRITSPSSPVARPARSRRATAPPSGAASTERAGGARSLARAGHRSLTR